MKKKIIIAVIALIILIFGGILLLTDKDYPNDENTLYSVDFDNVRLRFEHIDYVLGQNPLVVVQKSIDNGKSFETVPEDGITVSMEPKFVFLNKDYGFAIKKPNITKDNGKYYGLYVTNDGGKSFKLSEINYDNSNIEILTIRDVPYYQDGKLILHCSIYQVKEDLSGYEDKDLYFETNDDGITWYLK